MANLEYSTFTITLDGTDETNTAFGTIGGTTQSVSIEPIDLDQSGNQRYQITVLHDETSTQVLLYSAKRVTITHGGAVDLDNTFIDTTGAVQGAVVNKVDGDNVSTTYDIVAVTV